MHGVINIQEGAVEHELVVCRVGDRIQEEVGENDIYARRPVDAQQVLGILLHAEAYKSEHHVHIRYRIHPMNTPLGMLYVKGTINCTAKAGKATTGLVQSILLVFRNRITPIERKSGVYAFDGMATINGAKKAATQ